MQDPRKPFDDATEADEITLRLAESVAHENVLVLKYGSMLMDELEGLSKSKRTFDVIIIDASQSGFLFPTEELIAAATLGRALLEVQGAMVFVKQDKAAAFIKESPAGFLSFHLFESFSSVYDYSTSIAKHIQQAMGQSIEIRPDSTGLSEQILFTVIPVLTQFGIKLKAGVEGAKKRNLVLCAIDNYTPLNSVAQRLAQSLSFNDLLDELRGLEKIGAIYPIFPKIPFLVEQFRNGRPFKLKDYLVESRTLTREQLDDIIFAMTNAKGNQRLSLGAMCVAKGLLSARQLEICLQDQAFFGQQRGAEKRAKTLGTSETGVQTIIGNLVSSDPAGVLQNLSGNRANGVLTVDYRDLSFRAIYEQGKLTHAKQGKLKGNNAVTEFVSVWKEGVFVFLERSAPPDLANEECKVNRPLDKLLLDSALASDNIEAVWKKLQKGPKTVLEKLQDQRNLLGTGQMTDPQEGYQLSPEEVSDMQKVWKFADGMCTINDIIRKIGDLKTVQVAMAIGRLMHYRLTQIPKSDIAGPLDKFRNIIAMVTEKIGVDHSEALLRISLRESQGYSAVARTLNIGTGCEVGIDMGAAKAASLSLSSIIKALEDWQVKYIEHVSQELDKNALREIVRKVYQG